MSFANPSSPPATVRETVEAPSPNAAPSAPVPPTAAELEKSLAEVEALVAVAEAYDGAENISNAYGYYIDEFIWNDCADLFALKGEKELSYIGNYVGRERIRKSMITRYGNAGPSAASQTLHQKVQPYVTVSDDGQRAQIRERLLQMNSASTGSGSMIFGIYEEQAIK